MSGRLQWHIDHVLQRRPMKFTNKDARLSFIHSEHAGRALYHVGKSDALESVNVAAPGGVLLSEFITMLEVALKLAAAKLWLPETIANLSKKMKSV